MLTNETTSSRSTTHAGGTSASEEAAIPGSVLQQQIDQASGGTVDLAPGRYVLADSLRLKSGVRLRGHGKVVIVRASMVESELVDVIGYGHREFRPREPRLFHVGMGVAISDQRGGGFGTTIARIVGRQDGVFFTDTPASRDFRPGDKARVRSVFPPVAGYGVYDVDVDGLVIDGESDGPSILDGCRDAGVYLLGCRNVRLSNLEVRRYAGDAVSFQQCVDVYVQDCHLHHNAGHGLHPGSGSVRYVMRRNHVRHNGGCGIYYCLRSSHSLCQENRLDGNTAEGISVGERDTDHLIESNIIRSNGLAGIQVRNRVASGGDRLVISRNVIDNNGTTDGSPQLTIGGGIRQVVVENNAFAGGSAVAVRVAEGCEQIIVRRNFTGGAVLPASAVETASPLQADAREALQVGPEQLPADGARHLGIVQLPPWVDRCD